MDILSQANIYKDLCEKSESMCKKQNGTEASDGWVKKTAMVSVAGNLKLYYDCFMKKILTTLLLLFLLPLTVCGEELLPRGSGKFMTKETNPIYWGYMEDYAAALKEAFAKKKMLKITSMCVSYDYIVTSDGQIKDMKISVYSLKYYERKIKEVIESVPPPKFREGMNLEYMRFGVAMYYEDYEDLHLGIGAYPRNDDYYFHIRIVLKK